MSSGRRLVGRNVRGEGVGIIVVRVMGSFGIGRLALARWRGLGGRGRVGGGEVGRELRIIAEPEVVGLLEPIDVGA